MNSAPVDVCVCLSSVIVRNRGFEEARMAQRAPRLHSVTRSPVCFDAHVWGDKCVHWWGCIGEPSLGGEGASLAAMPGSAGGQDMCDGWSSVSEPLPSQLLVLAPPVGLRHTEVPCLHSSVARSLCITPFGTL